MKSFRLITALVTLTFLSNIGWSQCANECTIDFQNDGVFYNPSPFTDVTSGADIDIVAGASSPTLSGFTSDVYDPTSTSCAYATGNGNDFTLDFEIEPFFDVYGGNTIAPTGTGSDAGRYILHNSSGFQGRNDTNDTGANATSTGDVSCYNISVCFTVPQEAQNVTVNTTSINTSGETFESASIVFLDAACSPYGTATYNGFWASNPMGSNGGTNTTTTNSSGGSNAPGSIYTIAGSGVFVAADIGTVDITDPFNPVAATSGPDNNADPNASVDAGLAPTALVGGFVFRICLEDIAVTNNDDEETTSDTGFTSTLNSFEICLDQPVICADEIADAHTPVAVIDSESTCNEFEGTLDGGVLSAPTTTCPEGSTLEYSTDELSWGTTLPTYDQETSIKVYTRCKCIDDATAISEVLSVTTTPGACPVCPDDLATFTTPLANIVSQSSCAFPATEAMGGVIEDPTDLCPTGSTLQYSIDDGETWSTDLPLYDQDMALTIGTRCVCDIDPMVASAVAEVTTAPEACTICDDITITAEVLCTAPDGTDAEIGEYYIKVTGGVSTTHTVVATGSPTSTVVGSDIYYGPIAHSGTGTSTTTITITQNDQALCETEIVLQELICGYAVDATDGISDGTADDVLHASGPACDCDAGGDDMAGLIIAQAGPGSFDPATTTMVYVITDASDLIISSNSTGLYTNLANGTYKVYAYNILNTDLTTFQAGIVADAAITTVDTMTGCVSACTDPAIYTLGCDCSCEFSNLTVALECELDADGEMLGNYCATVSFEIDNPLSANYEIIIGGVGMGTYAYDLTMTTQTQVICDAGLLGDLEMGVGLVVRDATSAAMSDGTPPLLISGALPNPTGDDADNETVTILNNSCADVDLTDYEITDVDGIQHTFPATTTLAAGASIVHTFTGQVLNNSNYSIDLVTSAGITINSLSWTSSTEGLEITQTYEAAVCPSVSDMCSIETTFDEILCVDPAEICGVQLESTATTCNLDGTYDLEVCFSHMAGLTPHVAIEVNGVVVESNIMTNGGLQCITIASAGPGDGSQTIPVKVYEAFIIAAGTSTVGISEIHYDNDGTDTGEAIELTGTAGMNLSGYQLVIYEGDDGTVQTTVDLSQIIDDEGSGCGAVSIDLGTLEQGPEGIALVDAAGTVVEFISYEGTVTAIAGPAIGLTSTDIVVSQTQDPLGTSLQLTDLGWVGQVASSFGVMNTGLRCPDMTIPEVCGFTTNYAAPICDIECGDIACNNKVQISLGTDCVQCITPDMVLEGTYPIGYENYEVVITDINGDEISPDPSCVGLEHAGQELMVSVKCGENSCWGVLQIEDKLPPQLTNCAAIQADLEAQFGTSLQCSDLNADWDITVALIDSVVVECNTDFTVTTEQGLTGDMCSDDYRWTKRYIIDFPSAHGGRDTSHACVISLPVTPIDLADIICPADQEISCRATDFSPAAIFASYKDTTDAYRITQAYPYLINTAGDTIQLTSEHCNVLSNYADTQLDICQFKRKQIRKWTFIDWCTSQVRTCDQVIKMIDNEAMVCVAPPEFDIALGSHCLIDSTVLPVTIPRGELVIYAGCGNVIDTTIYYKSKAANREAIDNSPFELKAIKKADGTFILPPIEAPFDSIWLKYEFTNACGESCSAFTEARVIDNTPPTPVCNPDIAIAFSDLERGDDGLMKIFADAFDAESHDNSCGPVYFKIVRHAELNGAPDGYWNNSGPHGGPDYSLPPIANINRFCDSANGDDFGDVTLNGSELVSTGNQFWFDDHIKLCCTDDNFKVMMRVFDVDPGPGPIDPRRMHSVPTQITGTTEVIDNDLYGRFNDCWVDLEVQDKTQILGACVPFSLFCDEYPDNPMDNAPQINMACSDENIRLISKDSTNISECGNGLVIRDWYAKRSNGEEVKVCTQSIILQSRAFDPFTIKWPKSYVDGTETGRHLYRDSPDGSVCLDSTYQVPLGGALDCSDNVDSCEPTWDRTACSLLGLSSIDDTLFVDGDACMKIIRTWSVIDWCLYNENTSRDNSDNSDRFEAILDDCEDNCDPNNVYFRYTDVDVDGFYTYQQVLKIVDDQAPVLSGCQTRTIGITQGCTIELNINKTAGDGTGCGQSFLKWIAVLQDTSGRTLGTYPGVTANPGTYEVQTRAVPPGIYNVLWIVEDACGNESSCEEQYIVEDAKAPTPICIRDLSTVLMPSTGSLGIWASDYDLKSEDNCTAPIFSFSPDSIQAGITLTCDDMDGFTAKTFALKVYAFDQAGNADFCVVSLRVDSKDICGGTGEGGSAAIIQGYVATENGEMISDASAAVNAALPEYPHRMMTEEDGVFAFGDNPLAYDYDLSIEKSGDDVNGVTTLDIVLIQKHILGIRLLDSPYKMIAADANGDQKVSASDLVQIRKLILGVTDTYPNNSSWRFVDADETFNSIYNPWPFTEIISLGSLNDHMMHEDFVGVKIGDVNGNATANSKPKAEVRSAGTLTFNIEDRAVKAGDEFSVAFSADNFDQVLGYQLTLSHDGLQTVGISSNVLEMSSANIATFQDYLTMSWNSDESVITDEALFSIQFRADRDMSISEVLAINSRKTVAEAYISEALDIYDITLRTDEATVSTISESVFTLHQNQPNPFVEETAISFILPEANEASLTIMDVTGKLIMKITDIYEKGYNEVSLRSDEIQTSGVIYYQLESGKHIATKKMIIIE